MLDWNEPASNLVARGLVFLDRTYGPEWVDRIDLKTLDVDSLTSCVIAQLEGSYVSTYDGVVSERYWGEANPHYMGFDIPFHTRVSPAQLTEEWARVIQERCADRAKSPETSADHVLVA